MSIISILLKMLTVRKRFLHKKIYTYFPANVYIDKEAKLFVQTRFRFNMPWKPSFANQVGRLDVGKNAVLNVDDVTVRGGVL